MTTVVGVKKVTNLEGGSKGMETVTGVFQSRSKAEEAIQLLSSIGISRDRIGLLTPDMSERQVETSVRTTDSEAPGMGAAMGGAVGAAA